MAPVYPCPHCRAQNFATRARLRQAREIPLVCWKCGKEFQKPKLISEKYKGKAIKFKKK